MFGIDLINKISKKNNFNKKIKILIEVGLKNSRSGIRSLESLKSLIYSLKKLPKNFLLSGILFYEGAARLKSYQNSLQNIKKTIFFGIKCMNYLIENNLINNDEFVLSGGGSEFFDLVVYYSNEFTKLKKTK